MVQYMENSGHPRVELRIIERKQSINEVFSQRIPFGTAKRNGKRGGKILGIVFIYGKHHRWIRKYVHSHTGEDSAMARGECVDVAIQFLGTVRSARRDHMRA